MPRFGKRTKTSSKTGVNSARKSNAGRKPKPTNLHVLNGNPSKIDLETRQQNEPQFEKISPDCPDWLDDFAKEEWKRLAPELERLGLLAQVDMAAFAAYCSNYSTWRQADEIIKESGLVVKTFTTDNDGNVLLETIKKHPAVAIRSDAFEKMKAFLIEFGFTPASRSRVHIPEEEKQGKKKGAGGLMSR
jgi:P27 family predicted phage terminase small subunit